MWWRRDTTIIRWWRINRLISFLMMTMSADIVYTIAVHARSRSGIVDTGASFIAALVIDVFDVERVYMAGEVT
jgi:hypothetical protein